MFTSNGLAINTIFSKKNTVAFILFLFTFFAISSLVPPFQSPDEFDHVKRAYLLSKGQILLDTPNGKVSGGMIDTGLAEYMGIYNALPTRYDRKITKKEVVAATEIRWQGVRTFSPAPGTGYYFPLAYTPQALGLLVGETFDLSIANSYQLARFFTLLFSGVLFAVAFQLFPPNAFVLGILIVPMSLFQLLSASLDPFTVALTVLCISLFMRATNKAFDFTTCMSYALTMSILILSTSRAHLLPLVFLPLVVFYVRRNRDALWQFAFILIFSLMWLVIAAKTTHDNRVALNVSSGFIFFNYLKNPLDLIAIFTNTFSDINLRIFYNKSFIGILGWLDTYFTERFYSRVLAILGILAVLSVSIKSLTDDWIPRVVLLSISLSSIFLIFFALLVTWTPFPSSTISGVQGRYFLTPLIIFGYALSGSTGLWEGVVKKAGFCLLLVLAGMVAVVMPRTLIDRYFLFPEQVVVPSSNTEIQNIR